MEENMELKDIILDKDSNDKRSKLNKILVYLAIGLIIFIVIMVIMKLLNNSDDGSKKAALVLPNEPQVKNSGIIKSGDIFEQVPILPEKKSEDSFEKTISDLKINKIIKEEAKQEELKHPEPKIPVKIETQNDLMPVVIKPEPKKQEVEPKKVAVKPEPKKQEKPIKQSSKMASIPSGNYIQVLSVSKINLNDPFLKKLESAGYSYKIYQTFVNGKNVNKVLVGPYNDSKLKDVLSNIRANLVSSAFIYKVK